MKTKIHIIITATLIFAFACRKKEYPPTPPEIEYRTFSFGNSNEGYLTFYYHDLNGDLGLKENETEPPYDFDVFVTYYEKINGEFKKDTTVSDSLFWYRLPYIEPTGGNKEIDGTITIKMDPLAYNPFTPNDTFRYEFYIIDRALHKSNVAQSEELIKPQ